MLYILPEEIHVGVQENLYKWEQKVEDQPDIHHFDVRCLGEIVGNIDEHGSEYKNGG